jgi:type II secretory pathway component PulJ
MKPASRRGFSLLEVILATSMLLASAIVLAELANVGRRHADTAEDLAAAQRICQTRLNEMLAGIAPVELLRDEPLKERPGWVVSVDLDSVDQPGLAALRVTVREDVPEDRRANQFTLVRWIRDPFVEYNAIDEVE